MSTSPPPQKRVRLENGEASVPTTGLDGTDESIAPPTPGNSSRLAVFPQSAGSNQSQVAAERAVGITEYLNPDLAGFEGVLKQRYTDFLVNEIDQEGNVVRLERLTAKRPEKKEKKAEEEDVKKEENVKEEKALGPETVDEEKTKEAPEPDNEISASDRTALEEAIGAEATGKAIALLQTPSEETITTAPIPSKEARTAVHNLVRNVFSSRLITTTSGNDENSVIEITHAPLPGKKKTGKRGGKGRSLDSFAELGGEYCHFSLYKENRDTMEIVSLLPRILRIQKGNQNKIFTFAGTKDKRAVTVQRVAAYRIKADRLVSINRDLRAAKLGDFEYRPHGLDLGDLSGNQFTITLRQARSLGEDPLETVVARAVERVSRTGFANYYGLQRFGSFAISTSEIGISLLKGEWRGAVEKLLSYDKGIVEESKDTEMVGRDDKARAQACHTFFSTYDFRTAKSIMPRKCLAESTILRVLDDRKMEGDGEGGGLDYLGAIQAIPRNLRTMYVHAYQSYVWNHATSARLRLSRDKVLEGDLVLVDESDRPAKSDDVDQDGEVVIAPPVDDDTKEKQIQRARPLSKEEAESGKWTLQDLVLPSPGWDIVYPKNEIMKVYKEVMAKDGLDPEKMKRSIKEFSLTGSYRKIVIGFLNGDISSEIKRVKREEQVAETDLERIEKERAAGKRKRQEGAEEETAKPAAETEKMEVDEKVEMEDVVLVKMKLSTSCYATMALRELMKEGCLAFQAEYGRERRA